MPCLFCFSGSVKQIKSLKREKQCVTNSSESSRNQQKRRRIGVQIRTTAAARAKQPGGRQTCRWAHSHPEGSPSINRQGPRIALGGVLPIDLDVVVAQVAAPRHALARAPPHPHVDVDGPVLRRDALEVLGRRRVVKGQRLARLHQLDVTQLHAKVVLVKADTCGGGGGGDGGCVGKEFEAASIKTTASASTHAHDHTASPRPRPRPRTTRPAHSPE